MQVTVARLGRPNGLKGEVFLDVRTDVPAQRLVEGVVFDTDPAAAGPLTLIGVRQHSGRYIARFDEIRDRTAAEAARGVSLVLDDADTREDDAWYVHELVGLRAERPDGEVVGEVVDLVAMPAHDLLVVREPNGHRALIPFVEPFVPSVDPDAGVVVITPPHGLLFGEEPEATGETVGG